MLGREMAKGAILEALCDVIGELGRWELADETVAEAREFARSGAARGAPAPCGSPRGACRLARGDAAAAIEPLTRARDGFGVLGARWEAALAHLWLGEAQLAADVPGVHESAQAALDVFEELGSVQELEHARSLLSRIG